MARMLSALGMTMTTGKVMVNLIEVLPVLLPALAIVFVPLLADRPLDGYGNEADRPERRFPGDDAARRAGPRG